MKGEKKKARKADIRGWAEIKRKLKWVKKIVQQNENWRDPASELSFV